MQGSIKDELWYDSRKNKASPHDTLSRKLRDPYTKAHPLRLLATSTLSMLIPVTCSPEERKFISEELEVIRI